MSGSEPAPALDVVASLVPPIAARPSVSYSFRENKAHKQAPSWRQRHSECAKQRTAHLSRSFSHGAHSHFFSLWSRFAERSKRCAAWKKVCEREKMWNREGTERAEINTARHQSGRRAPHGNRTAVNKPSPSLFPLSFRSLCAAQKALKYYVSIFFFAQAAKRGEEPRRRRNWDRARIEKEARAIGLINVCGERGKATSAWGWKRSVQMDMFIPLPMTSLCSSCLFPSKIDRSSNTVSGVSPRYEEVFELFTVWETDYLCRALKGRIQISIRSIYPDIRPSHHPKMHYTSLLIILSYEHTPQLFEKIFLKLLRGMLCYLWIATSFLCIAARKTPSSPAGHPILSPPCLFAFTFCNVARCMCDSGINTEDCPSLWRLQHICVAWKMRWDSQRGEAHRFMWMCEVLRGAIG